MSFPRYAKTKVSGVEWLGDVPEHWEVKRLKQACHVFPSNVDKKCHDGETPVVLCNYTDVYYNERITRAIDFMAATASTDQIAKFTLRAGDTIITKDSETPDDIAVAAYVPKDLPGVVCGYHLSMVRPMPCTYGAFVKRLFDSIYAKSCFATLANGLTRFGLGQYELDNVALPFPPISEQITIAEFLDRETAKLDALVVEQRRLIELLKEKRQAVISHAVTKGLNPHAPMKPSGIEWLGDVPEHWDIRRFGQISNVVRGGSPRPAGDPLLFNGDYSPWVTVAEITKDEEIDLTQTSTFLTEAGSHQSRLFSKGTLLFSNSGGSLGVPKILQIDANANDGVLGFENLSLNHQFAYFYLSTLTEYLRETVRRTGGSTQINLNTELIKQLAVPVPPADEVNRITAKIFESRDQFRSLESEAERAIDLLQERRTALISAAVTGKIDVRGLVEAEAA